MYKISKDHRSQSVKEIRSGVLSIENRTKIGTNIKFL